LKHIEMACCIQIALKLSDKMALCDRFCILCRVVAVLIKRSAGYEWSTQRCCRHPFMLLTCAVTNTVGDISKILLQHPITKYQPQPSFDISNTSKCRHLNPSINTLASFMPYIQYIAELPPYICSTSGRLGNPTHLVCHLYALRTIQPMPQ
jgi:hypothetical protein